MENNRISPIGIQRVDHRENIDKILGLYCQFSDENPRQCLICLMPIPVYRCPMFFDTREKLNLDNFSFYDRCLKEYKSCFYHRTVKGKHTNPDVKRFVGDMISKEFGEGFRHFAEDDNIYKCLFRHKTNGACRSEKCRKIYKWWIWGKGKNYNRGYCEMTTRESIGLFIITKYLQFLLKRRRNVKARK